MYKKSYLSFSLTWHFLASFPLFGPSHLNSGPHLQVLRICFSIWWLGCGGALLSCNILYVSYLYASLSLPLYTIISLLSIYIYLYISLPEVLYEINSDVLYSVFIKACVFSKISQTFATFSSQALGCYWSYRKWKATVHCTLTLLRGHFENLLQLYVNEGWVVGCNGLLKKPQFFLRTL